MSSRTTFQQIRSSLYTALQQRQNKWILSTLGSLYATWRTRQPCLVSPDPSHQNVWIHRYLDGVVVDTRIRENFFTLSHFQENTKSVFLYKYSPTPGDVVIDVGAGIGGEVLAIADKLGVSGQLFAFEAHPTTFKCLEVACRLNDLNNVTPLNLAISDVEGELVISDAEEHIGNHIFGSSGSNISVPALSIDDFIEQEEIEKIDFLKMNIEGAEKFAVKGMKRSIKNIKNICISCHDFKADREGIEEMRTKALIREFLKENEFEIYERTRDERPWVRDTLYGLNRRFL